MFSREATTSFLYSVDVWFYYQCFTNFRQHCSTYAICQINPNMYGKDRINKLVFLSPSFCTNGLSYSGKETQPTLCIKDAKPRSGVVDLRQNKHQLLHRMQSVRTFTNL